MELIQAIFVLFGLSLDGFVLMMNKGATLRKLDIKKASLYSLVYCGAAELAFLIGYIISIPFKDMMGVKTEILIAAVLVFGIGIYIFFKGYRYQECEERVDDSFDLKECFKLACFTNLDTICLGASCGFSSLLIWTGMLLIFVVAFIVMFIALNIGYRNGSKHTRAVGMVGGLLIICLSIFLLRKVVLGM